MSDLNSIALEWFTVNDEIKANESKTSEFEMNIDLNDLKRIPFVKRLVFISDLFKKHFLQSFVYDKSEQKSNNALEYVTIFQRSLKGYSVLHLLNDFLSLKALDLSAADLLLYLGNCSIKQQSTAENEEICVNGLVRNYRDTFDTNETKQNNENKKELLFDAYMNGLDLNQSRLIYTSAKIHNFINHSSLNQSENENENENNNTKSQMRSLQWRKKQQSSNAKKYNKLFCLVCFIHLCLIMPPCVYNQCFLLFTLT